MLREVVVERRSVLRSLGAGALGLSALGTGLLAACGGGDGRDRADSDRRGGHEATRSGRPADSVEPYDPDRPYWEQGNFAAVDREVTETRLEVTGAIPPTLSGLYVRNGSNPAPGGSAHWFDGDGMLHGVRLEQGRATWYRNRWVATTVLDRRGSGAGDDAGAPGEDRNHANVSLVHYDGRLLALGEIGWPYEIAPGDLSTVGPWNFGGALTTAMTAHPKVDPDTGLMHFFGYGYTGPLLTYHVADADGRLVHSEQIDIDAPMMVHDFAVTDRDVIFWLGPLMFGFRSGENLHPDFPFYWDPDRPTRVGVMPLGGPAADIRWVETDPCYVFHGLNAHRDGDEVVLRVHRLPSVFGTEPDFEPTYLTEWRIDTGGEQLRLREQQLSDVSMDMPTIDRRLTGRPVSHGWCTTTTDGPYGWEFAGLNHVDLETGRDDRWEPGPMEVPGEALFVADTDGDSRSDEGWLLTYLYDRTVDRSSLAVYEAQAVADGPVARVRLPVRVPHGFHGLWLPDVVL